MVFYFSGTGNSRYAAQRIAAALGDQLLSMNDRIKAGDTSPVTTDERLVIVTPTYAWRIPRLVEDWLRRTEFPGARQTWFVMTCGGEIGNAVKYAPQEAEISILLTTEQGMVQFCIENSNTHIPNDCLPKLFDAFYRVEQSRNRKTGGSGLGLYLVQKILAQYGSCCTVCNTPTGVRFSFSLSPSIFT